MGIECPMSQGDSLARDSRTRQVAAIFRALHHCDEGLFVYMVMLPTLPPNVSNFASLHDAFFLAPFHSAKLKGEREKSVFSSYHIYVLCPAWYAGCSFSVLVCSGLPQYVLLKNASFGYLCTCPKSSIFAAPKQYCFIRLPVCRLTNKPNS